jgi:hypothetical protein
MTKEEKMWWTSFTMAIVMFTIWFVVMQEKHSAQFRQDQMIKCLIVNNGDADACAKWKSEW